MKITMPILAILVLTTSMTLACKQKKIVTAPAPAESTAPLLKSDVWQGTSDQVDPQLGKIKSLD